MNEWAPRGRRGKGRGGMRVEGGGGDGDGVEDAMGYEDY